MFSRGRLFFGVRYFKIFLWPTFARDLGPSGHCLVSPARETLGAKDGGKCCGALHIVSINIEPKTEAVKQSEDADGICFKLSL